MSVCYISPMAHIASTYCDHDSGSNSYNEARDPMSNQGKKLCVLHPMVWPRGGRPKRRRPGGGKKEEARQRILL